VGVGLGHGAKVGFGVGVAAPALGEGVGVAAGVGDAVRRPEPLTPVKPSSSAAQPIRRLKARSPTITN
jgi:hypothetical protein